MRPSSELYPVGTVVNVRDCYGKNLGAETVIGHPGPFSVTTRSAAGQVSHQGTSLVDVEVPAAIEEPEFEWF